MCGSKLLFFCTSRRFGSGIAAGLMDELGVPAASPADPVIGAAIGVSHTTVPGMAACRVLPATSTRPCTDAVDAGSVADACVAAVCACSPSAPAYTIANASTNFLWLIIETIVASPVPIAQKSTPSSDSDDQHCSLGQSANPLSGVDILRKTEVRSRTIDHVHKTT